MRLNENVCIVGDTVILVPYKEDHVPRYHEWMKSEELQHQTASEPLSLEEEYEMQKSWHVDENKCTFIVLDKAKFEESGNQIDAMIGDTNLFLSEEEDHSKAEAEIMIAEKSARGKKRGWEAMLLMLRFGCEELKIKIYEVKIKLDNVVSIKMFDKIGFSEVSQSEVFGESTMEKLVSDSWYAWLLREANIYKKLTYSDIKRESLQHTAL